MAIGKTGVKIDLKKLSISFGDIKIIENGKIFKNYKENEVANYMKDKLNGYYKTSDDAVAHEFILELNEFKSIGITEVDIAKRLIDYSFHPPTMSWPQKGTLMIEPTESEPKEEMDRFIRAMICIRDEINTMPELLKNAPHPISLAANSNWDFPYTMREAFFPLQELKTRKFWPSISRVNDVYGDQLFYKKAK